MNQRAMFSPSKDAMRIGLPPAIIVVVLTICPFAAAAIWYVDKDNASGTENGQSWPTAFKTLQPAIDAASADDGGEVWVSEGVYGEARTSVDADLAVNTGAVQLRAATSIYGGFSGAETDLTSRDWKAHPTIIDGSTARDGASAYHVIEASANTVLDGVTVRGGNANGAVRDLRSGGGLSVSDGRVLVRNSVLEGNSAAGNGGAVRVYNSFGAVFESCAFSSNGGGTVYCVSGQMRFTDCVFSGNSGGAIFISAGTSDIVRCKFLDNSSSFGTIVSGLGGAAAVTKVYNSIFAGNHATTGGAIEAVGMYSCDDDGRCEYLGFLGVYGCTFYGNSASTGGTFWITQTPVEVWNSVIWSSAPDVLHDDLPSHPSPVTFSHCIVQGGYAGDHNLDKDPLFVNPSEGDFRLQKGSPGVDTGANVVSADWRFDRAPLGLDLDGLIRPQGVNFDIGAFESPYTRADVNGDGPVDAVDIQVEINVLLGLTVQPRGDVNSDGHLNAVDLQLVINAALSQ